MKILLTLTLSTLLIFSSPSWGAEFDKVKAAYLRGDFETALRILTPLAEQGVAEAQSKLGWMFKNGEGVLQDYKIAAKWTTLAAEQGDAIAQSNLGVMFERGEGVPQDYRASVKWYTLAAEQGDAVAQSNLAYMYLKGWGVLNDYIYAHMWYNISALNGHKAAIKYREYAGNKMTQSQIEKAQELARKCVAKNYREC